MKNPLKYSFFGKKMKNPLKQKNLHANCWSIHHPILKQGVCRSVALPFYIKKYLTAKEEL
jgi:hypothetical protein